VRCALLALVAVALGIALPARAHTRSQSFSTWKVHGGDVVAVFTVPALEATRLAASDDAAADLGALVREHLAERVSVARGGARCERSLAPRSLAAQPGLLRVELRFVCTAAGPLRLRDAAFFDLAATHVHYARLALEDDTPFELLFTEAQQEHVVGPDAAQSDARASFTSYFALGVEHIAGGADHVAFLVALLLLCRRLQDVAFLVTGFTLGHSLTLALATLGIVRPAPLVVEALIGFTIALVAAEDIAARARSGRLALSLFAAGGLGLLALAHRLGDVGLPELTSAGLALFALAYLPLVEDRDAALRFRPFLTLLFGLVHGFGFANVLLDIGLAPGRLAVALVGFNLGIEAGQLVVVAALWILGGFVARRLSDARAARHAADLLAAALCALGVFWLVERSLAG